MKKNPKVVKLEAQVSEIKYKYENLRKEFNSLVDAKTAVQADLDKSYEIAHVRGEAHQEYIKILREEIDWLRDQVTTLSNPVEKLKLIIEKEPVMENAIGPTEPMDAYPGKFIKSECPCPECKRDRQRRVY